MNAVQSLLAWDLVFLALCAGAGLAARRRFRWHWALAGFALFNLNVALVLNLFHLNAPAYRLAGDPEVMFNWAGKLIALAASLAVLFLGPFQRDEVGFTLKQAKGAWIGWSVVGVLCAVGVGLAISMPDETHTAETIAYQLTMPSLEEELFFRGLLLCCLIRAFGPGPRFAAANFGLAAFTSTAMFALIHALSWTSEGPVLSVEALVFAGVFGWLLCWLRLNTGSLVAPILMHSAINTIWRIF
ncbi:MAG: CPBP family intramembrane glutamic endopeptidase [Hyphomonas sp.]|uniref:CPBP family intramembrane glutamic endopeptidase n=1 Tax=Hyphomonas sp. TaxID=87 RepID=UPI0035279A5C